MKNIELGKNFNTFAVNVAHVSNVDLVNKHCIYKDRLCKIIKLDMSCIIELALVTNNSQDCIIN